jgi:peptide/nickel transport system substrate-binding protein
LPKNPLGEPKVREAIDLALDRPALAEVSMEGLGKAVAQIVPAGAPGHDDKLQPLKPNLERARALLAEAGYADGFRLRLGFTSGASPSDRAVGMSVARMLSRIGLEAEAGPTPAAAFGPALARGDFALAVAASDGTADAQEILAALARAADLPASPGAPAAPEPGARAELARLLEAAAIELDEGKRKKLLEEAAALFARERLALPLVAVGAAWAMRKDRADLPRPRADGATLASEVVPVGK